MSTLLVSHDLHLMMLEFVIDKLYVPKISQFDTAVRRKTTVMFRFDNNWLSVTPKGHVSVLANDSNDSNDSNDEEEEFHGGISIVFAIPSENLQNKVSNVNIDVHLRKDTSKYFEMPSCYNVGLTHIPITSLFNGIIKELKERKQMQQHFKYFHVRKPISRSMKDTYMINNEQKFDSSTSITIYTRLNYLGKSIITEIKSFPNKEYQVREETCEDNPYQCRKAHYTESEIGYWDSDNAEHSLSVKQKDLTCINGLDIWQSVKTEAEGIQNSIMNRGIKLTSNTGENTVFMTNNAGRIPQGISMQLNENENTEVNKKKEQLDKTVIGQRDGDKSRIKHKIGTTEKKKETKKKKRKKIEKK